MSTREPQRPGGEEDIDLMRQVGEGSRDALETLVRRHQQPLLNFFRRMGVYNDAEDMVQETFVRLLKFSKRYRPEAKFTTFLYTVARSVCLDAWRRNRRRLDLAERVAGESEAGHDGGMGSMRAGLDVRAALERLPEKLRSAVVLSVFQGLKYEEIAGILGVPVGTVKSRMFLAMERLKEILDEGQR